jgi:hypothetical protein
MQGTEEEYMFRKLLVFGALFALVAGANATSYTNETDWLNNLGAPATLEDFSSVAPLDFVIGKNTLPLFNVELIGTTPGSTRINDVPNFVIDFADNKVTEVKFQFPEPIYGFAGLWSNTFVTNGWRMTTPSNIYDLEVIMGRLVRPAVHRLRGAGPVQRDQHDPHDGPGCVGVRVLQYVPVRQGARARQLHPAGRRGPGPAPPVSIALPLREKL